MLFIHDHHHPPLSLFRTRTLSTIPSLLHIQRAICTWADAELVEWLELQSQEGVVRLDAREVLRYNTHITIVETCIMESIEYVTRCRGIG